jgi:ribonuclease P protein component
VLPAGSRLRRRPDFTAVMRQGCRAGRPRLVVHLDLPEEGRTSRAGEFRAVGALVDDRARAGFVVSRAVGTAVVRNRVRRQLRHLVAARLDELPAGTRLVVRVLPAAAGSTSAQLATDLDAALERCLRARPHQVTDRRKGADRWKGAVR